MLPQFIPLMCSLNTAVPPRLNLNFLTGDSLDSRITFSRGSQATLFDSTGALVYAKHNLLLQSQTFQTTWTVSQSSVSADSTTAPDGTTTADTLVENTANAEHYARQNTTQSAGSRIAFSVFVKAAGRTSIRLRILDNAAPSNGFFGSVDTSTGATASGVTGTGTVASVTASALSNGWYRLVVVGVASPTATTVINDIFVLPTDQNSASLYTGNGTSGVFLWGAQVNLDGMEGGVTSSLSTYYPTTTTAYYAPRFDYNPSTLAAQGLLIDEQRTNSIRNNTMQGAVAGTPGTAPTNWTRSASPTSGISNEIVGTGTESGITYIDLRFTGTATATVGFSINLETSSGAAASASQTWTTSTYAKLQAGSLNGSTFQFVLNEYSSVPAFLRNTFSSTVTPTTAALNTQRSAFTVTTGASTAFVQPVISVVFTNGQTYDFTLRIGLPQLEQGAFATSVIPTTTTALTRNADVASMTGTNFSSWYNQSEGTLFAQYSTSSPNSRPVIVTRATASANDRIQVSSSGANVLVNNVSQANIGSGTNITFAKQAFAYKANDFAGIIIGLPVSTSLGTDTSGNVPSVDYATIGYFDFGGGDRLSGHIQRITYYPVRLPNSTLQALTA